MTDNSRSNEIPYIYNNTREAYNLFRTLDVVFGEYDKAEQYKDILKDEDFDRKIALLNLNIEMQKRNEIRKLNSTIKEYFGNNRP